MTSHVDGTTPDPPSRHHCPACGNVTLAPRGLESVACGSCGKLVADTMFGLDCLANFVRVGEELRALEEQGVRTYDLNAEMPPPPETDFHLRLPPVSAGEYVGEYSREDVELTKRALRSRPRVADLTDEEIFRRMRELANRIQHDRHAGDRGGE